MKNNIKVISIMICISMTLSMFLISRYMIYAEENIEETTEYETLEKQILKSERWCNALDDKIGVSEKISSFTVPLGATINMDGTAIMQGVAVVFVAQAFGIHLGINEYLTVILTATLASIGTA